MIGFVILVAAVPVAAYYVLKWYAYDNWIVTSQGEQIVVQRGEHFHGPRAQVGVEVGGRRNAARERARAGIEQYRLGRREHLETRRDGGGLARERHVAGGVLEARNAAAE